MVTPPRKEKVLMENNLNVNIKQSKTKQETEYTLNFSTKNTDALHDSSIDVEDDDVENDPDWKNTPLYNRIQKLQNKSKLSIQQLPFKLEPDEIKCAFAYAILRHHRKRSNDQLKKEEINEEECVERLFR
ncbi:hypothetical protein EAI_11436 [Harpegnathos saltator]|uniref:Uncharacterized protein n=1 Tax=Harpegnathos saltator TaxID=610380 RepID=E2BRZ6_HARSA|nr:hypothetical protein EAI_11436 [Harpegnathos saltator]